MYCLLYMGHIVDQVANHWPLTMEAQVQYQATPYRICDLQSVNEVGFSLHISVFPLSLSFPRTP